MSGLVFVGCGGGSSTKGSVSTSSGGGTSGSGGTGGGAGTTTPSITNVQVPAFSALSVTTRLSVGFVGTATTIQWSEVDSSGDLKSPSEVTFTNSGSAETDLNFIQGAVPGKKFIKVKADFSDGSFKEETREVTYITGGRLVKVTLTDFKNSTQGDSIDIEVRNAVDGTLSNKRLDFSFQVQTANSANVLKQNPLLIGVPSGVNEGTFSQFLSGPDAPKSVEFSDLSSVTGSATEGGVTVIPARVFVNPNPPVSSGQTQALNTGKSTQVIIKLDP